MYRTAMWGQVKRWVGFILYSCLCVVHAIRSCHHGGRDRRDQPDGDAGSNQLSSKLDVGSSRLMSAPLGLLAWLCRTRKMGGYLIGRKTWLVSGGRGVQGREMDT